MKNTSEITRSTLMPMSRARALIDGDGADGGPHTGAVMKAYNASMSTSELTMTMTRINGTFSPKILNVSVGMRFSG